MLNKDLAVKLAIEALKTVIVLFTLLILGRFIETLPFAGLPVFDQRISAADLLAACVSAAAIAVFLKAGSNARVIVDELAGWLPGAGTLLAYLMRLSALLYAYAAFQPVTQPFIGNFEWIYQSVFLAVTLFLLAKAVVHVHGASESVSRAILAALNPYKEGKPERVKASAAGRPATLAAGAEAGQPEPGVTSGVPVSGGKDKA